METDKEESTETTEFSEKDKAEGQEEKEKKNITKFDNMMENVEKALESTGNEEASQNVYVIETLYYLENNTGVVGDQVDIEELKIRSGAGQSGDPVRKAGNGKSIVEDRKELMKWMEYHYADFEMAFLIALSVFEKFPYLWVYDLAESLFDKIQGTEAEKEEKRKDKEKIPRKRRIEDIGGQIYFDAIQNHTGSVESEFICFQKEEYADKVLKCVWEEFLSFRETMVEWVMQHIFENNLSKTIRAVQALSKFAIWDFYYSQSHVIKILMSRKNIVADFGAAQIMVEAGKEEKYCRNVEAQFRHWATLGNLHTSLAALMLCVCGKWESSRVYQAVDCYMDWLIRDIHNGNKKGYLRELPTFFAIGGRKAFYLKAMVSVLYDRLSKCKGRQWQEEKRLLGFIFQRLLEIDDKLSVIDIRNPDRHKDMALVKMCVIRNDMTPKICALWNYIWTSREHRKRTRSLLEHYLYQYGGCGPEQNRYLRKFLFSFTQTEEEREDMRFFLEKLSYKRLFPIKEAIKWGI